jgi:hypothetical protein
VEVSGLLLEGAEPTLLSWDGQGTGLRYDIVTGTLAALLADQGSVNGECLENDVAGESGSDSRQNPAAGEGFYYLVRAENVCGSGGYGTSTAGGDRTPLADCP